MSKLILTTEDEVDAIDSMDDYDDVDVSDMSCQKALVDAFFALERRPKAQAMIRMMIMQCGLEHLGSDCSDGKLTTFMDTVIFG